MTLHNEGQKARHWREQIMKMTLKDLSRATGYSITSLYYFENNTNSAGQPLGERTWQRYRMACLGVLWNKRIPNRFDWDLGEKLHADQQR